MFFSGQGGSIIRFRFWTYATGYKKNLAIDFDHLKLICSTFRLFAEHCPKCEMPLNTNDMVQKVKNVIFHQECFRSVDYWSMYQVQPLSSCSLCARPFSSGDEFLLIDLRLFCRQCHEQDLDHHAVRSGFSVRTSKKIISNSYTFA